MRHRPEVRGESRVAVSVRPRYGRIGAAAGSLVVTLVAVLGGMGVLSEEQATARTANRASDQRPALSQASQTAGRSTGDGAIALSGGIPHSEPGATRTPDRDVAAAVPTGSGSGRRIVFDMTAQRVWLVGRQDGRDVVRRTYLVSGSVTDNLEPGTYSVYSRSLHAWGVDDSGSMRYMVRFAHGSRAAIGFHDIPELDGVQVQTRDQLGAPQSHGCIRQWRPDARALWSFAPVGTKVVVVA
jgi:hypothetical protein